MVGMIKLATNRARLTIETKFDLIGRQAISSQIAAYPIKCKNNCH